MGKRKKVKVVSLEVYTGDDSEYRKAYLEFRKDYENMDLEAVSLAPMAAIYAYVKYGVTTMSVYATPMPLPKPKEPKGEEDYANYCDFLKAKYAYEEACIRYANLLENVIVAATTDVYRKGKPTGYVVIEVFNPNHEIDKYPINCSVHYETCRCLQSLEHALTGENAEHLFDKGKWRRRKSAREDYYILDYLYNLAEGKAVLKLSDEAMTNLAKLLA